LQAAFGFDQDLEDDFGLDAVAQQARWLKRSPVNSRRPSLALVEDGCPEMLCKLLQQCWSDDPASRPLFGDIVARLAP
jgi:hypothetical protein